MASTLAHVTLAHVTLGLDPRVHAASRVSVDAQVKPEHDKLKAIRFFAGILFENAMEANQ